MNLIFTRKFIMATAQKKKVEVSAIPANDKEAKKKALATALSQIEKKHGAGSVMRLGDNAQMEVQAVSTPLNEFDFYEVIYNGNCTEEKS